MSPRLRDSLSALNYFALVCLSALSISFIVSIIVYNLGIPAAAGDYVRLNLFITGCIAIPTAVIATLNDVQSRAYQRRLEELAWTDDLTGLLNRRFFLRAADEECRRMRRTQQSAAVAIIDLDFFKEVNDLYGHAAGDRVLKAVAQIAHAELRGPFDKLGRWGGEEFVVLLTDVTPEKARIVCERLRSRIQTAMIDTGLYQVYVTASFGFCMLNPGADVNACIESADRALYQAKGLGRNRVEMSEPPHPAVPVISDYKRTGSLSRAVAHNDDVAEVLRAAAVEDLPRTKRFARAAR
jgi:diguanylate cyclase (GGDEF)-like protein